MEPKFDLEIGTAVVLPDGRKALITGRGIYDNQYWCEVSGADGVNPAAADYHVLENPTVVLSDETARELSNGLYAALLPFGVNVAHERCKNILHLLDWKQEEI